MANSFETRLVPSWSVRFTHIFLATSVGPTTFISKFFYRSPTSKCYIYIPEFQASMTDRNPNAKPSACQGTINEDCKHRLSRVVNTPYNPLKTILRTQANIMAAKGDVQFTFKNSTNPRMEEWGRHSRGLRLLAAMKNSTCKKDLALKWHWVLRAALAK